VVNLTNRGERSENLTQDQTLYDIILEVELERPISYVSQSNQHGAYLEE
jgi:hypothetical protein